MERPVPAPGTSFTEAAPGNSIITYRVKAKYPQSTFSDYLLCSPPIDTGAGGDPVVAPATCTAAGVGLNATITWTAVAGASDYRIYRSVDGSPASWRGKVQGTTFTDTLRSGMNHHYTVQAQVGGTWSTSTDCTPDLLGGAGANPVTPPAACTASAVGLNATITWTAVAGASDYRIYRSVDGSPASWRGKVQGTTFTDTLRSGMNHHYTVQAQVGGTWSTSTDRTPTWLGSDGAAASVVERREKRRQEVGFARPPIGRQAPDRRHRPRSKASTAGVLATMRSVGSTAVCP
ncbi:MAG: hypothetical protein R2706_00630 [Acidimicrobiales bacterium]